MKQNIEKDRSIVYRMWRADQSIGGGVREKLTNNPGAD